MQQRNPKLDFRYLKQKVGIGELLSFHGLDKGLKQRNRQLYGPCPLHHGDNATAFRVDLERGLWHCFTSCGGGDTVELVRRILNCSYAEAAHHLLNLARGIRPEKPSIPHPRSPAPSNAGFVPFRKRIDLNPKLPFLQGNKKVSIATAVKFEAGWSGRSLFLRSTAAVRLHDFGGNPLGYCGRRLDPDDIKRWGKWRFPKKYPKGKNLFNAHRALPYIANGVVVVECPWAVLRLAQAGIPNAVALLGTSVSPLQISWLSQAPKVLLLLDGDKAGRKAAPLIARTFTASTRVIIHNLPQGMEPEDFSDRNLGSLVNEKLLFF